MEKFLIEVYHDKEEIACALAAKFFLSSGSHFLTNAEWGCNDDVHKAWMIVEVENREEARRIIPSPFKSKATIVQLNRFTWDQVNEILSRQHYEK
jgi:hypothetical protein